MNLKLLFTPTADEQLTELENNPAQKAVLKAVQKSLGYMETNLKHRSLQTHKFTSLSGPNGEDVFESYAQNRTPGAFRIFWYYGPAKREITIVAITPHP